ncbi:MAG: sugar isomerase [Clostridia bacterium]|nr:sugar isomerase [Clostridia bacterium]
MDQKKRSQKIFISGLLSQIVTLLLGIIIPRLVIVSYGSEVNGLLSSVRQIFVYVALLEAGIGTASLQALYAPIAAGDHAQVSSIMAATDRYYKRTGTLYALAVILLAFLYPFLVKSEIPFLVVAGVIFFQGASGVINYFFQGKFAILLRVDGRSYVTANLATIVNIVSKLAQIALILAGCNILAVQVTYFVINVAQMLYISRYIRTHYTWLDLTVKPDYEALQQSKNVIIHQVSGLIFNNTDILVLTFFCGLKAVSVYSLYSMIVGCVSTVIDTICSSVEFILGQAFHSDRKRFLRLQEAYETYYLGISFAFFTVTLVMLPSFIQIYSAGITDTVYTDRYLPYLFVILNVLMYARRTSSQIINFAGHFKQTQWRSILESVINLSVSLVMVYYFGIYGVLLGTIAALLYRTNDIILYANLKILGRKPWRTYRRWLQNTVLMIGCVVGLKTILPSIGSYLQWFIHAVWITPACFLLFFAVDSAFDSESFFILKSLMQKKSH